MSDRVGRISLSAILAGLQPATLPYVVTTVATGPAGREMLDISGPIFERYAVRIGADYRPLTHPEPGDYPLGYKFAVGRLFDQWERVLFLDADIVLADDCPNLFDIVAPDAIGIHDDFPHLPDESWVPAEFEAINRSQGWSDLSPRITLNTGVIVASREHAGSFDRPTKPIPVSHTTEQSTINLNIARYGYKVQSLPRVLNWQWWIDRAFRHTDGVKVWHLANCPRRTDLMRLFASNRADEVPAAALTRGIYPQCKFEGGVLRPCGSCSGEARHVRECDLHGECTRGRVSSSIRSCLDCPDYQTWDPSQD